MENVVLWLALSLELGSSAAGGTLIRRFGSAEDLFSVAPETRAKAGEIPEELAAKLRAALRRERQARDIAAVCRNFGWTVLTPESACYPKEFSVLRDPPPALYACGEISVLRNTPKAAVVGTRTPSDISLCAAYDLGAALSGCGIVTVSGGAVGIDSAAHEGALTADGGTVCVLGCGLGSGYLPERVFMRRRIARSGVLLTELPPFTDPTGLSFPRRNRMIAALGASVTVIQSGVKGGSMITAQQARAAGKKLFALSERVYSSPGCAALIAQGAEPIVSTGPVAAFCGADADWAFHTGRVSVPPVLTPARCSLASFAALNGATETEALPLYRQILEENRISRQPAAPRQPEPAPARAKPQRPAQTEKAAPSSGAKAPPKAAEKDSAFAELKRKIADAQALTGDVRTVFLALERADLSLDDVSDATGLPAGALMQAVTVLELADLAETLPGNRVRIKLT